MISNVPWTFLDKEDKLIPMLELGHKDPSRTICWIKNNLQTIEALIIDYGGMLLRSTGMTSLEPFNQVSKLLCKNLMKYENGITPRKKFSQYIYSSTEYNPKKYIPLHNECSYDLNWPRKLLFFCMKPPVKGGETILGDSKKMLKVLAPDVVNQFMVNQLVYVRHYNPRNGSHWKSAFGCLTKSQLVKLLETRQISYKWNEEDQNLSTFIAKPGILSHPSTGEDVWFNQAHLFNPSFPAASISDREQREVHVPVRDIYFENGETISNETFTHINDSYHKCTLSFPWRMEDLLILDNIRMSHGRNSYEGEREIVVSMGN